MVQRNHLKHLRDRLQRGMDRKGWRRTDLARASGKPASTVKRVMDGDDPKWTTACKLLAALGEDGA